MDADEQWLTEHGYKKVSEYLWGRNGWPRVVRATEGARWAHVPRRGAIVYRATARQLVQDVLFMRDGAAREAYDRARARWQEACR